MPHPTLCSSPVETPNTVTGSQWNAPRLPSQSSHVPSMTLIYGFSINVSAQTCRSCTIAAQTSVRACAFVWQLGYTKTGPARPGDGLATGCHNTVTHKLRVTWLSHHTDGAGFLIININSNLLRQVSMHYPSGFLRKCNHHWLSRISTCSINTPEGGNPGNLECVKSARPCRRSLIRPISCSLVVLLM